MSNQGYSRLRRNVKKSNYKTIILSIVGILALLILLLRGFPLILDLIGSSSEFFNKNETDRQNQNEELEVLIPPSLIDIPNATSSAYMRVGGISEYEGTIEIYLNEKLSDEIEATRDEEFKSKLLKLTEGSNTITTKIKTGNSESNTSDPYYVNYVSKEPTLEISFPGNDAHFVKADKRITIQGKTEESNILTINGGRGIVGSDGSFSHLIELTEGTNQIIVVAASIAGSKTEKSITVSYSRE